MRHYCITLGLGKLLSQVAHSEPFIDPFSGRITTPARGISFLDADAIGDPESWTPLESIHVCASVAPSLPIVFDVPVGLHLMVHRNQMSGWGIVAWTHGGAVSVKIFVPWGSNHVHHEMDINVFVPIHDFDDALLGGPAPCILERWLNSYNNFVSLLERPEWLLMHPAHAIDELVAPTHPT